MQTFADVPTPALVDEAEPLAHDLAAMAAARPGPRLRPHGKALVVEGERVAETWPVDLCGW